MDMAVIDIGELIFRQILQVTAYPGAPFTGEPIRDLIMFFLIPTIFIVLLIYIITDRFPTKLRMILSIGIYLFVIAGGYFQAFMLLSGPYFIVLIFVLGLIWFIFRGGFGAGKGRSTALAYGDSNSAGSTKVLGHYENMSRPELLMEKERIQKMIIDVEKELNDAKKIGAAGGKSDASALAIQLVELKKELRAVEHQLNIVGRFAKKFRFA